MASASSRTSPSFPAPPPPPPPPPRSPLFTPIPELEKEEEDDETEPKEEATATPAEPYKHQLTPLHPKSTPRKKSSSTSTDAEDRYLSVLCNKCRPSSRDKISIVPLDINGIKQHPSSLSPNPKTFIHSLFLTLTRNKSPKTTPTPTPTPSSSSASSTTSTAANDNEWKLAAQELSRKLLQATRKRDEALLEASRLKYSVSELERKLNRLESYCLDLKSSLDRSVAPTGSSFPTDPFLRAVSDARSAVRFFTRSLSVHLGTGSRSVDRIASLLQPYDVKAGKIQLVYIEAVLNRVFYEEFERCGEEEGRVLNPAARCELNRAAYEAVRGLGWEEVLSKGTKHYSEGLSRFCDKKMSEVVGMMGWARAWPESLLQAFFGAAKGVWMVYLLARCVHPAVPILRVEGGVEFDSGYMEDVVAGERVRRLTPVSVRAMVAPGFYVYSGSCGMVKCKVLCTYSNTSSESENNKQQQV